MKADEILALEMPNGKTIREYYHNVNKLIFGIDCCSEMVDNRMVIATLIWNNVISGEAEESEYQLGIAIKTYDEEEYEKVVTKMLNYLFLPKIQGELKI
jgi:hypothetical protein